MSAILLHSGKSEHFRALGETGQPVHHAALQLRKVISRRLPGKERHLAVPQRDQQGEGVDWYSGISGDVVPWRSATEEERANARTQLEAFRKDVVALNQAPVDGLSGDHRVFTRLVKWVGHFPDESFIYLVDGTPVITFWGFIHPEADRHANPLLCLYPSAAADTARFTPPSTAITPPPEPEHRSSPIAPARPWWRRWWWLLPLALAIGLLLLVLRACSPSVNDPGLTAPTLGIGGTEVAFPRSLWQGRDTWPFNRWGSSATTAPNLTSQGLDGGLPEPSIDARLPEMSVPDVPMPDPTAADSELPGMTGLDAPLPDETPELDAVPDAVGLPEDMVPPELVTDHPPTAAAPGGLTTAPTSATREPLILPPDAADGHAAFLNGNWRGAGVMDNQTGRPLQVTYVFDQGEGHMHIQRGGQNGMTCTGPVNAAMLDGRLNVEAQQRARCEDGSHYEMPRVQCHQGDAETASCAASYDDESFPIQLHNAD